MSAPLVVLDAKALLLAYVFPGGSCSELLDRAISHQIRAVVSPGILDEFSRVLTGPSFFLPPKLVGGWVEDLRGICDSRPVKRTLQVFRSRLRHEDNDVISCAASAGAGHIVTGDRSRLLHLGSYRGIAIADPTTFLQSLGMVTSRR